MERETLLTLVIFSGLVVAMALYSYLSSTSLETKLKYQRTLVSQIASEIRGLLSKLNKLKVEIVTTTLTSVITVTKTELSILKSTVTKSLTSVLTKTLFSFIMSTVTSTVTVNNTVILTSMHTVTQTVTKYRMTYYTKTIQTCPLILTLRDYDIAVLNLTSPVWLKVKCLGRGTLALGNYVQYYILRSGNSETWKVVDAQTVMPCNAEWIGVTRGVITIFVLGATAFVYTWTLSNT